MTCRQGQIVFQEEVARLLAQLDSAYFLENENFRRYRSDLVEAYRSTTVRQASHATLPEGSTQGPCFQDERLDGQVARELLNNMAGRAAWYARGWEVHSVHEVRPWQRELERAPGRTSER